MLEIKNSKNKNGQANPQRKVKFKEINEEENHKNHHHHKHKEKIETETKEKDKKHKHKKYNKLNTHILTHSDSSKLNLYHKYIRKENHNENHKNNDAPVIYKTRNNLINNTSTHYF